VITGVGAFYLLKVRARKYATHAEEIRKRSGWPDMCGSINQTEVKL